MATNHLICFTKALPLILLSQSMTTLLIPHAHLFNLSPGQRLSRFAPRSASALMVRDMRRMLGIPPFRLGKLVGAQDSLVVYKWIRLGGAATRPSPIFLYRMIRLVYLKYAEGIDVTSFKAIDWEKGVATLYEQGRNVHFETEPDVPNPKWRPKGLGSHFQEG